VSLGTAAFFALLVASLALAVLVVRARTPDLVLEVTAGLPGELHPGGSQRPRDAEITFFVRESDPDASVAIVDSHEDVVRTLDRTATLTVGDEVTYVWDGTTDAGAVARPGRYRLLVELPDSDREMVWPRRITVGSPASPPDRSEKDDT
jgi:hypothetical protein